MGAAVAREAPTALRTIRKRFVEVEGRLVHYRTAGEGPPVVLLHDSPRSSALHLPLLEALSDRFTVIALDTPGYGLSDPLPGGPFELGDFSRALTATLDALGIGRAGFYGFHTSSKILLDFAVQFPERVSLAIMDGLSIPPGGPDPDYIERYMRRFELDEDGAYIAREWTRLRDSGRWFPWFDRRPANRIVGSASTPAQLHQSFLDYFNAGPHYADAYRAAMFYLAAPQLAHLRAPAVIMARSDDVLFSHLDRLPAELPPTCRVERLGPDREAWRARLAALLAEYADREPAPKRPAAGGLASDYLDLPHGQVRLRRLGAQSAAPPILFLHETPGGAGAELERLAALARGREVLAPDLPGCGESDPLVSPTADAYAEALAAVLDAAAAGPVDVIAEATSTPLALRLMAHAPHRVRRAVLDAILLPQDAEREALAAAYCPPLAFESSGAHLHRTWQMVRDQQVHWPWYDASAAGVRRIQGLLDAASLHRRFLDVLTQMHRYGDAVAAALAGDARPDMAAVRARTLVFRSEDPRDRHAGVAASLCPNVELAPRPLDRGEWVERVLGFLDSP
jgi:pimeloyl-ACP methyl ester carboxylesterase